MKRIIFYNTLNRRFNTDVRDNLMHLSDYIYVITPIVCGNIIGSVLLSLSVEKYLLLENIIFPQGNYINIFLTTVIFLMLMYLSVITLSLCCIGTPLITILLVVAGVFSGAIVSYFLIAFRLKGILYFIISFFPATITLETVFLILGKSSISLSKRVAKKVFFDSKEPINFRNLSFTILCAMPVSLLITLLILAGKYLIISITS